MTMQNHIEHDESRDGVRKCRHPTAEPLGTNNMMTFLRCLTCRAVIVSQNGLTFAIPPVGAAG